MYRLKLFLLSIGFLGSFVFAGVLTQGDIALAADLEGKVCSGAEIDFGGDTDCAGGSEGKLDGVIASIINIISVVVGIIAVIMIIYGGFRYITSAGDSGNISTAKNIIIYAIIGLIIVALAQVIVRFVLSKA